MKVEEEEEPKACIQLVVLQCCLQYLLLSDCLLVAQKELALVADLYRNPEVEGLVVELVWVQQLLEEVVVGAAAGEALPLAVVLVVEAAELMLRA